MNSGSRLNLLPSPTSDEGLLRYCVENFRRIISWQQYGVTLTSPNGTLYVLVVDDAGNLSTVAL